MKVGVVKFFVRILEEKSPGPALSGMVENKEECGGGAGPSSVCTFTCQRESRQCESCCSPRNRSPWFFPCGQCDLRNGSWFIYSYSFKGKEPSWGSGVLMEKRIKIKTDRKRKPQWKQIWRTVLISDSIRAQALESPPSCVTLGKLLKLSEPLSSHLWNRGHNDYIHFQNCCENKYILIPKALRIVPDHKQCAC